uniref:Uncharacterized protein n=1 Tax=Clandestinovirus TaxID=2831644 RepID=A0A8F8KPW7_9VIRU|nr:hypothetical protein KOM_12_357 [Clandestinovirus]
MSSKKELETLKNELGTCAIPKTMPKYFPLFFKYLSAYKEQSCIKYAKLAKKYWQEFAEMGKPRKPRTSKRKREEEDAGPEKKKAKTEMEEQIADIAQRSMSSPVSAIPISEEKKEAITTYRERIYEKLAEHQLYPEGELAKEMSELFSLIDDLVTGSNEGSQQNTSPEPDDENEENEEEDD